MILDCINVEIFLKNHQRIDKNTVSGAKENVLCPQAHTRMGTAVSLDSYPYLWVPVL
jgi:hypothetical protein